MSPMKYTEAEMLLVLRQTAKRLGRTPRQKDMRRPSPMCYRRRFGSFCRALEAAGIALSSRRRNKVTAAQRAAIARAYRPPTRGNAAALAHKYGLTVQHITAIARGDG
jgi:hypothetical protein